ncbi:MAG: RsmB/NOP family class I SAM-dependent RNA methyltransferase [Candidatus Helarchaeota archaeon]
MKKIAKGTIKTVINLLSQFLERKAGAILDKLRSDPEVTHYYFEIIRFWNKLNYMIQKTCLSLGLNKIKEPYRHSVYLLATYRLRFESASIETIRAEIKYADLAFIDNNLFQQFLTKLQTFSWEVALKDKDLVERLSLEEAVPTFLIHHLLPVMSYNFLKENLQFMNAFTSQTDCTFRLNVASNSALLTRLKHYFWEQSIAFSPDSDVPGLFHIPIQKKSMLIQSEWYQSGRLVFQDKASAAVAQILSVQPNEHVWDMCAAPGMKTSLINQYVNGKSLIIATDVHKHRIYLMKKLLKQDNLHSIRIFCTDGVKPALQSSLQFDRILLDAPCTGSGTFQSNPTLKWRQTKAFLQQNCFLQAKLLETALKLLKLSGILVYSTCSLLPEEGELQILNSLEYLEPLDLPDWLRPSYPIKGTVYPGMGRLFPAIHKTQGFFIAKFRKVKMLHQD